MGAFFTHTWTGAALDGGAGVDSVEAPQVPRARWAADAQPDGGARYVAFVDEDGDRSQLSAAGGRLRWCTSTEGLGCREVQELRVERKGPCHFQVAFVQPWKGSAWTASIADPPPGVEQRRLVGELLSLARETRVRVLAPALGELGPDAGDVAVHVVESPVEVPAPIFDGAAPRGGTALRVRLPGRWAPGPRAPCLAVVQRQEDCNSCAFADSCESWALPNQGGAAGHVDFEVPRPPFSLAVDTVPAPGQAAHAVCLAGAGPGGPPGAAEQRRPIVVGHVAYYHPPVVRFLRKVVNIGVRTFLNPGWRHHIKLECTNCTRQSRLVVEPVVHSGYCNGLAQQALAALAAAARDGQVPPSVDMAYHRHSKFDEIVASGGASYANDPAMCKPLAQGPCVHGGGRGADRGWDLAIAGAPLDAGPPEDAEGGDGARRAVTFLLESDRRLLAQERQVLFHHRGALCFYAANSSVQGWLVGFVHVHMDGPDMQAFIGFVCFFGVALPLICLVTALLHYNKYERCKQHVQQLRMEFQREQLDREMAMRRGGRRAAPAGASAAAGRAPPALAAELPPGQPLNRVRVPFLHVRSQLEEVAGATW